MTLISDDLALVAPERIELASVFLPPLPRSAAPIDLTSSDMPECFDYVDERAFDPVRIAGLFNFDDAPKNLRLDLPEGEWHAFDLWRERYLGVHAGSVGFDAVPAHGCRVIALRPVTNAPALVGTNAHIGCGILDISDMDWDQSASTLRLTLEPVGRRARRLWIATAGRAVRTVMLDGAPLRFVTQDEAVVTIDVNVAQTSVLEVAFA
jgi:hypothetical protein